MSQIQVPDQMTAVVLDSYSGVKALRVEQRPVPEPGHDEVLVKVALIFEDKAIDGFWLGPWTATKNLIQIQMIWRRAQKLISTELKSEIRTRYPLLEAQEAVREYLSHMTGGKVLLTPSQ